MHPAFRNFFRPFLYDAVLPLAAVLMIAAPFIAPAHAETPRTGTLYTASTDGILLRAEPGPQGGKIAAIPFGEAVKMVREKEENIFLAGTYGRWTEIEWKGKKGWAFGGLLTPHDPATLAKTARGKVLEKYPVRRDLPPEKAEKGEVRISKILGNFAIVERDRFDTERWERIHIPYLMKHDGGAWRLMEEITVHDMRGGEMRLFHLDDDGFPDVYTKQGCCDNYVIFFYRSDAKGSVTRLAEFDLNADKCLSSDEKTGRCGATSVTCVTPKGNKEIHVFDCEKNSFVKTVK